jgi:hypothetical protein
MLLSELFNIVAVVCAAAIMGFGWIAGNRLREPLLAFIAAVDQLAVSVANGSPFEADLRAASLSRAVDGWLAEAYAGGRSRDASDAINDTFIFADVATIRRLEALPSQIVGTGLLLTFTFLAFAIYTSGQAIGSDTAGLESAMRLLLSTAGAKFVTSIAAILTSLVLISDRTKLLTRADRALGSLAMELDERFLRVPATDRRIASALGEQATAMTAIEAHITKVLAERETVLAGALSEAMAPVARSLNSMADTISSTNAETMAKMVAAFANELGGATLRYNQDLADILRTTSETLQHAPAQMAEATRTMEQLISAASARTRLALDGAEIAFGATTAQLAAIAKSAALAEQRLAGRLDAASSESDAAAQRLAVISERAEAAVTKLATLDNRTKAMTETVALATRAANDAADVHHAMKRDMGEWTVGMAQVDAHVASLIARVEPIVAQPGVSDRETLLRTSGLQGETADLTEPSVGVVPLPASGLHAENDATPAAEPAPPEPADEYATLRSSPKL